MELCINIVKMVHAKVNGTPGIHDERETAFLSAPGLFISSPLQRTPLPAVHNPGDR